VWGQENGSSYNSIILGVFFIKSYEEYLLKRGFPMEAQVCPHKHSWLLYTVSRRFLHFGWLMFSTIPFRNPDEDQKPWCFIRNNGKVQWDFCDVSPCSGTGRVIH